MKHISPVLAVGLPLLSLALASGTLQFNLRRGEGHLEARRVRRSSALPQAVLPEATDFTGYFANISVGTPPQAFELQLDTGSSDVWVVAANLSGTLGGTFNANESTTFDDILPGDFAAKYADGTTVSGDYFTDSITIGGVSVNGFQMGLAYSVSNKNQYGILGVSFSSGEATPNRYPTICETMVAKNVISTTAYSVWLNNLESSGAILFGGIDTAKYTGNLYNIAMWTDQYTGAIDSFQVSFTSLSVTSPSGTTSIAVDQAAAVLDTGSTNAILPDEVVTQLYSITGAVWSPTFNASFIDCSARSLSGSFNFGFAGANGPVIAVPISELIYPYVSPTGEPNQAVTIFPHAKQSDRLCVLAVTPRSNVGLGPFTIILGDAFLRSAYVVFDLANKRIGMAQSKFNSTGSNIVPFASSGAPIPSATIVSEPALTYSVTGTLAVTSQPVFTQTAPFFEGAAGVAFASAVETDEAITNTAMQTTGSPTTGTHGTGSGSQPTGSQTSASSTASKKPNAASPMRPFVWSNFIMIEAMACLCAVGFGFAIVM